MVCEQVYSNAVCLLLVTSLVWPGRPWDVPFTLHNNCQVTMDHSELCHICPVNFIVKATAIVTYTLEVNSTQMLFGHCQQLKQLVGISPSFIVWMITLAACSSYNDPWVPLTLYFNWQRGKAQSIAELSNWKLEAEKVGNKTNHFMTDTFHKCGKLHWFLSIYQESLLTFSTHDDVVNCWPLEAYANPAWVMN